MSLPRKWVVSLYALGDSRLPVAVCDTLERAMQYPDHYDRTPGLTWWQPFPGNDDRDFGDIYYSKEGEEIDDNGERRFEIRSVMWLDY